MDQEIQESDLAYSSLPIGFIKEELEEPNVEGDQDEECTEHQGQLKAYAPLPYGPIKVEFQSGDEHADLNSEIEGDLVAYSLIPEDVVKEEPISEEDDDYDGCELVAYAPLPHGVVKTEPESRDALNGFQTEIQMPNQGEKETQLNQNETFVDSSAADIDGNDTEPPMAVKRKRSAKKIIKTATATGYTEGHQSSETRPSSRILRSHSKVVGSPRKVVEDGAGRGKQLEKEKLGENNPSEKEKEQGSNEERMGEHSSLEDVDQSYEDSSDEDLILDHAAAGPSQSKKTAIDKQLAKIPRPEEKRDKPFICKNCGSSFKLEEYLKRHLVRTCGVEPQFACNECGHKFKTKADLRKHLMSIHKVDKSQLSLFGAGPKIRLTLASKCDKCGRTYKNNYCLAFHLKYQCQKDFSFPCNLCEYRGTHKSNLRSHLMRVHDVDRSQFSAFAAAAPKVRPEQPFKCKKCGRSYKQRGGLNQHLKFACGVLHPSFPCDQCDYRATHKSNLRSHLISVHNLERSQLVNYGAAAPSVRPEQPFKCEKCKRTYKHKKHLNFHSKFECGKNPSFQCNQCDYRASQKSTLNQHIINIHGVAGLSQPEA